MTWHRESGEGRPTLAALMGPSGIGKSKLLEAFRHRVRLSGGVVLEARCEGGQALHPFARIAHQALRFLMEVDRPYQTKGTALGCSEGCHPLWYQHSEHGGPFDPERLLRSRDRFSDAMLDLLRAVSRVRPPVIVLHNLEDADRASLELLHFILEAGTPHLGQGQEGLGALFVAGIRTDDGAAPDNVQRLVSHRSARLLTLHALDEDGVRALLQAPDTVARILNRTGGSPAAIRRLLEAPPPSPEDQVERLRADLPERAQHALALLCAAERPVSLTELQRALQTPLPSDDLAALERSSLLRPCLIDGQPHLAFARDAEREHVYGALSDGLRAQCHGAWANALDDVAARARHALSAGDLGRASELGIDASRALATRHAPHEAAELLEAILAAMPEDGQAALPTNGHPELRNELVCLYRVTGDYRLGLRHAKTLRDLDPKNAGHQRAVGDLLVRAGRLEEAATALRSAHKLAREAADQALALEVETLIADLLFRHGDLEQAEVWASRALDHAPEPALSISARNTMGKLALTRGDREAATKAFNHNQQLAREQGLSDLESQAWANLGFAQLSPDAPQQSRPCFERALELAERAQNTRRRAVATEALAVVAHFQRDYRSARDHYQQALTLMQRLGTPSMVAGAAANLGELYLSLGEVSRAEAMCDLATQVGGAGLPTPLRAEGLLLRGHVASARGDSTSALASFQAARDIFESKADPRIDEVALELCHLALEDGNVAEARKTLLELAAGTTHARRARIAILAARIERAADADVVPSAERAANQAERSDDDELRVEALTLLGLALSGRGQPRAGRDALERAWEAERRLCAQVPDDLSEAFLERPLRRSLQRASRELEAMPRRDSSPPRAVSKGQSDAQHGIWRKRYPKIVGSAPGLCDVFRVLDRAAASDMQVLIRGESGTGKELVAEALHTHSERRDKQFVRVNCAALVETLLLSELFGHERGAFTGASARRKGRFEVADGGTLFLDEIGDISPRTQAALLRVLQEGEFERVGGTQTIKVNVRLVTATHRDLEAMVRAGTFREDLYYRLRGVTVQMPALRERSDDMEPLTQHLLDRVAKERDERPPVPTAAAIALLRQHAWPGNVRELENVLRSASLFCDGHELTVEHLRSLVSVTAPRSEPEEQSASTGAGTPGRSSDPLEPVYDQIRGGESSLFEMKKRLERECIERALQETGGNITRAATLLGMKRPRLSQLVKQYELAAPAGRQS